MMPFTPGIAATSSSMRAQLTVLPTMLPRLKLMG
jgi:hypothetical protein